MTRNHAAALEHVCTCKRVLYCVCQLLSLLITIAGHDVLWGKSITK